MPSGRTHDRITLWSLPFVAGVSFFSTRSSSVTLLVAGGFLFGGLMFGPDLDIYSIQFQRWGILRWIWLPYQKNLRHRSFLSHGPIIGTTLRVVYLLSLLAVVAVFLWLIFAKLANVVWNWQELGMILERISLYYDKCFALFVGLELGAMSHSLSDWTGSAYKRFQKQGIQGIFPKKKTRKPKVSSGAKGSQTTIRKSPRKK